MTKQKENQDLERMIREMPEEKRFEFFLKALERNKELRNQFLMFFKEIKQKLPKPVTGNSKDIIADAFSQFTRELKSLDFDNMDWRDYVPRHSGYIEDYEAWEDFADDHLSEVFGGWKNHLCEKLKNGEIYTPICEMLGLYDACFIDGIPGSENVFEDLTEVLLNHHQEMMNDINRSLAEMVGSGGQVTASVDAILEHFLRKHSDEQGFLKYMEPTLLLLAETEVTAGYISEQLEEKGIDESTVPQLALKLASFNEDKLIWLEKAQDYMELDFQVARQLMDYYWTDDPVCFIKVGRKLFQDHRAEFCNYFSELLYPMFNEEFYAEVLRFRTLRDRDIDLYQALRGYLTEEEKATFASEIRFDHVFKVRVLAMEKRFPEALAIVQKEALSSYDFSDLIIPLLNIYPVEVLDLIRIKCNDMLLNHKKRSAYKHVAKWLKMALQINGMEERARHVIHELYNRKPAMPALKDEMRKAGVVK